jgi:hypothetical protein
MRMQVLVVIPGADAGSAALLNGGDLYGEAEPERACALEAVAAGGLALLHEGVADAEVLEVLAVHWRFELHQ